MKRTLMVLGLLLIGAGAARAQVTFRAGGSVGGTLGGLDNEIYASLPTGGDLETHNASFALQVVAQFTPRFSVELAGESMKDKDWEERSGISMTTDDIIFYPVTLTARYSMPVFNDAFKIYCLAGIGDYVFRDFNISIEGAEAAPGLLAVGDHPKMTVDNTFGCHAGLGLEVPINRSIEMFAEIRFAVTDPHAHMKGVTALSAQGQYIYDTFVQDISDNRDIGSARIGMNYVF